jgi:co-chaperonin GroES (HSP10)
MAGQVHVIFYKPVFEKEMITKVPADFVLVRVDSEFNDKLVIKGDDGDLELKIDTRFRPTHHSRICAEVIAPCDYLSGRDVMYEKHPGLPVGTPYRGHDFIEKKVLQTPRKYRKDINIPYRCGSYEAEFQTLSGIVPDVKNGDIVYHHFNCLLDHENFVGKDGESLIYKIPYAKIFCRVRDGVITMLNGYIFVSEVWDDDAEDVAVGGFNIKARLKGALVTETVVKPKFGIGKLEHIGEPLGSDARSVSPGEIIMYVPSAKNWDTEKRYGFTNNIEGRDYYVMSQWDVFAITMSKQEIGWYVQKFQGQGFGIEYLTIKPVGDYVMIAPERLPVTKTEAVVYDPNATQQNFKPGQLFILPETAKKTKRKGNIPYGIGNVLTCGESANVPQGAKVMYGKSAFYVYLEEEDKVFVRKQDIFGWFE